MGEPFFLKRAFISLVIITIITVYHITEYHTIKRLYQFSAVLSQDNCLLLLQTGQILIVICKTEDSDLETHSELTNWLGTITIINKAAVLSDGYECRRESDSCS